MRIQFFPQSQIYIFLLGFCKEMNYLAFFKYCPMYLNENMKILSALCISGKLDNQLKI